MTGNILLLWFFCPMSLSSLIFKCLASMVTSIVLAKLPSLYCPVMWRNLSSLLWKSQWSKYLGEQHCTKQPLSMHVRLSFNRIKSRSVAADVSIIYHPWNQTGFAGRWTQIKTKTGRHKEKWAIGQTTGTVNSNLQYFDNRHDDDNIRYSGTAFNESLMKNNF